VRTSVVIGIGYLAYLAVTAAGGRADAGRPWRVGAVAALLIAAACGLEALPETRWVSIALDCLPGTYVLAGYWLPALIRGPAAPRLQAWLLAFDRRLFSTGVGRILRRTPRLVLEYLELAYTCCSVVVPLGLAWLWVAGLRETADAFWTAVLLAALPCFGTLPWFETRPPREVEPVSDQRERLLVRRLSVLVLRHVGVGANTFPSGHVAASLAAALAVGSVSPVGGAVFGVIAVSIAVASVVGRYHYAVDAVIGALMALAAFGLSRFV